MLSGIKCSISSSGGVNSSFVNFALRDYIHLTNILGQSYSWVRSYTQGGYSFGEIILEVI